MNTSPLCALGHVATRSDLERLGLTRRITEARGAEGQIVRVRRGLYACHHLTDVEQIAVTIGARLDCVTVLARHKIWVGHERGLHLRMSTKASAVARERLKAARGVLARARYLLLGARHMTVHWVTREAPAAGCRLEASVIDALRSAMRCMPPDDLVAALESAVHLGKITEDQLRGLIAEAPRRLRPVLAQIRLGAESGYETRARLKLQRAGHQVEIQVAVPGVGRVDMVIDRVVAFEVDGRESHAESFESDRDRDIGTELWGLRGLRVPAAWVDTHWDEVLGAIERMIDDARRAGAAGAAGAGRKAVVLRDTPRRDR